MVVTSSGFEVHRQISLDGCTRTHVFEAPIGASEDWSALFPRVPLELCSASVKRAAISPACRRPETCATVVVVVLLLVWIDDVSQSSHTAMPFQPPSPRQTCAWVVASHVSLLTALRPAFLAAAERRSSLCDALLASLNCLGCGMPLK